LLSGVRHLPFVICHLPFAIPHFNFRDPELGSFCIKKPKSIEGYSFAASILAAGSIGFVLHFLDDRLAHAACRSVIPGLS